MEPSPVHRAAVIGGGSFGTALGLVLARKGADTRVWVRQEEQAQAVNADRENKRYLPGTPIPDNMRWTTSVAEAVEGAEIVMVAIPTQFLRPFLEANRSTFPVGVPLVLCAKGLELGTEQMPFDIVRDELPGKYGRYLAVLSGPSFAKEIAKGLATAVSVAAEDQELATKVQCLMSCPKAAFRCYRQTDVIGCEIAGAMKNVLAIASGASTGIGLGQNARAGLICRGLSEITTLAVALGSSGKSMAGLAGVGDLLLTCSSELSRNFSVGLRMAQGESLEQITSSTHAVAEGVATARSLEMLCRRHDIHLPICHEVFLVLYEGKNVGLAIKELTSRPLRDE